MVVACVSPASRDFAVRRAVYYAGRRTSIVPAVRRACLSAPLVLVGSFARVGRAVRVLLHQQCATPHWKRERSRGTLCTTYLRPRPDTGIALIMQVYLISRAVGRSPSPRPSSK